MADRVRDADRLLPSGYRRMLRRLRRELVKASASRHRRMLVVSSGDPEKLGAAVGRALSYLALARKGKGGKPLKILYMYHHEFEEAEIMKEMVKQVVREKGRGKLRLQVARYEESERYLGATFSGLVLDLTRDLKPNDVGRLVGIVEGGGLVILAVPPWDEWDTMKTLFKTGLVVPSYPEPRHIFIKWFKRTLVETQGTYIYDLDSKRIIHESPFEHKAEKRAKISIPSERIFPLELYRLALTQDQVEVIERIESLVEKPKKRWKTAIVVTADRGRGKSCALGIGLIGVANELRRYKHKTRILVTAPSPSNVQSLMELAFKAAETLGLNPRVVRRKGRVIEIQGEGFSLEYWEPYTLTKIQGDIVAVDEAAGIPVPLLHTIWRRNRRMVFATTIHGYEGAGRGFSVRFLKALQEDKYTRLTIYEMHEPIRYAEDDPVEKWLFRALLLDAEPVELGDRDINDIREGRLEYVKLDPEYLFSPQGEETLRQLFGIYVLAHYRNQPDDLGILADAPHHSIRALRTSSGAIVCAAQVAEEGGLDDELIEDLIRGGRIPGNIIPDRILKHIRIRDFGRLRGWRIVRIATHPAVQGRGIGSRMLEELYRESIERGYHWLGSGFGATERLLRFWSKNGFTVLHMSPDRNPVSGEYTVLVLKPIASEAAAVAIIGCRELKSKIINSLQDNYRDLETPIALQILRQRCMADASYKPRLTPISIDRLWIYSYGPMTYEAVCDVMFELARAYWYRYPERIVEASGIEEHIMVARILQGRQWDDVASELHLKVFDVMRITKELGKKFGEHLYGHSMNRPTGLSLRDLL